MSLKFLPVRDTPGASARLWDMMVERSTGADDAVNISHRTLPDRASHNAFVRDHPYAAWFLVSENGLTVGSVSLTQRNEIGILLFKAHRGRGLGAMILRKFMETVSPLPAEPSVRPGCFVANINPRNLRSRRLFRSLGFELCQITYRLNPDD